MARGSALPAACVLAVLTLSACVPKAQHDALVARTADAEKQLEQQKADLAALRGDLDATRQRMDNALRASADANSESFGDRAKLQALGGKVEEQGHAVDELKKELASTRQEIDGRLDELKRSMDQGPKPPPVTVPADKPSHFSATEAAHVQKDWALTRTLAREYLTRYPEDNRADDVLYLSGDASLKEGRPASALGDFNRLLKQFPKSNVLGPTLLGMGEAYLALHDCPNAKLAFEACEARFSKDKLGEGARARLALIARPTPGLCSAR